MAFLTLDDVTVRVATLVPAEVDHREVGGETERAFAGNLLSTVKGHARVWRGETPPLEEDTANTYTALLQRDTALTCAGDMIGGSVAALPRLVQRKPIATAAGTRWVLVFELHEQR